MFIVVHQQFTFNINYQITSGNTPGTHKFTTAID